MKRALLVACALSGSAAWALKPIYTYNGVGRPFEVWANEGEVKLFAAGNATPLATGVTHSGRVDLADVLQIWSLKPKGVCYLQQYRNNLAVGAPLVLQPMLNPAISRLKADGKTLEFVPDEDSAFAGYRTWLDQDAVFDTSMGSIRVHMRPDAAPNTVWNFLELVKGGFYRDVIFHRVVAKRKDGTPFVIQGGDPTGRGSGSPGYAFPLEDSPLPHDFGVISMARSTDPNTNGSQFFFGLSRAGTQHLDHKYASFGQAISGADTILKIAAVPVGAEDHPKDPPLIRRIRLVDADPYGTGPKPVMQPK